MSFSGRYGVLAGGMKLHRMYQIIFRRLSSSGSKTPVPGAEAITGSFFLNMTFSRWKNHGVAATISSMHSLSLTRHFPRAELVHRSLCRTKPCYSILLLLPSPLETNSARKDAQSIGTPAIG